MIVKLTDEQVYQLQPLIDRMIQAWEDDKPVMLLGQIARMPEKDNEMYVGIIPHKLAKKVSKLTLEE